MWAVKPVLKDHAEDIVMMRVLRKRIGCPHCKILINATFFDPQALQLANIHVSKKKPIIYLQTKDDIPKQFTTACTEKNT